MNAKKYPVKVGIIGGTGIDNPNILEHRMERRVNTPYGEPSDILIEGKIRGVDCVLLARHGRRHTIMPSKVNYRANIWALKSLGCTHVVASTATGSLRETINPGDMVILDSFIDRTTKRHQTFYDGEPTSPPGICHLPMEPAYCPETRTLLINAAEALQFKCHRFGTCVAIEGPRFSSKAESTMFRAWGGDVINMTTCPEVVLAKEAGLCYAAVALVTDYDCWRDQEDSVSVSDVMRVMKHNSGNMVKLLVHVIPEIAKKNWDETIDSLRTLITSNIMLP